VSKLREIRQAKTLTQEEVARKIGLTVTGYRQIEIDAVDPKLSNAMAIAAVLGVAIEDIWSIGTGHPA